jgi:hypothetical protein
MVVYPVGASASIVCYPRSDLVCDGLGRTGGWEPELLNILQQAAQKLRRKIQRAATVIKQRTEPSHERALPSGMDREFRWHLWDDASLNPKLFSSDDVLFLDIGANVGAFTVGMWERGFSTLAIEAMPHNILLLSLSRCVNFADAQKAWNSQREELIARFKKRAFRVLKNIWTNNSNAQISPVIDAQLAAEAERYLPGLYNPRGAPTELSKLLQSGDPARFTPVPETVKRMKGPMHASIRIVHAALGESPGARCAMQSDSSNIGDVVLNCDTNVVDRVALSGSTSRMSGTYAVRGYVRLMALDSLLFGPNVSSQSDLPESGTFPALAPREVVDLSNSHMRRRFQQHLMFETESSPLHGSESERLNLESLESISTPQLLRFVSHKHVICKIDVEGFEESVFRGAPQFMGTPALRPRLIVSEVWRRKNISSFGHLMIVRHGYIGLPMSTREFLRTLSNAVSYHEKMAVDMDTILWVDQGYEFLLPYHLSKR